MFTDAANGFSGTQGTNDWTYVLWNGSSSVDLGSYDSSIYETLAYAWYDSSSGAWISASDLNAGNSTSNGAIRVWTAPKAGTVNIVGWALKNTTGSATPIGISHGGTWIWPNSSGWGSGSLAANDQVGQATTVSNITVAQGDKIGFWVGTNSGTPASSTVSWAPIIAYH